MFIPGKTLSKSMSDKTMSEILSGKLIVHTPFPLGNYPAVYNFASVHAHYRPEDDFDKRKKRKRGIGDIEKS